MLLYCLTDKKWCSISKFYVKAFSSLPGFNWEKSHEVWITLYLQVQIALYLQCFFHQKLWMIRGPSSCPNRNMKHSKHIFILSSILCSHRIVESYLCTWAWSTPNLGSHLHIVFFIYIESYPVGKTLAAKSWVVFAFKAMFNSTVYCRICKNIVYCKNYLLNVDVELLTLLMCDHAF